MKKLILLLNFFLILGCSTKDWKDAYKGLDVSHGKYKINPALYQNIKPISPKGDMVDIIDTNCERDPWDDCEEVVQWAKERKAAREAQGSQPEDPPGSVSSSQPSPVVQNRAQLQNPYCKVSPAGQKVCSHVYTLSDIHLSYIDQAWFQVLSCVKRYNSNIKTENISPPTINVVKKDQIGINCKDFDALGCYDFRSKQIWIALDREYFKAIYMEYGHHIDNLAGLEYHSNRHGFNTYSIQCSYDPLRSWWTQSDYLKEIFGGESHH